VRLDIGLRGVVAAFGRLASEAFASEIGDEVSWIRLADWFSESLNMAFDDGLLDFEHELLRQVVVDHDSAVWRYRLGEVGDAFGAYIEAFAGAFGHASAPWPFEQVWDEWTSFRDRRIERLMNKALRPGYKRQIRPALKLEFPHGGKALTDAVNAKANQLTAKHATKLHKKLEALRNDFGDGNR